MSPVRLERVTYSDYQKASGPRLRMCTIVVWDAEGKHWIRGLGNTDQEATQDAVGELLEWVRPDGEKEDWQI